MVWVNSYSIKHELFAQKQAQPAFQAIALSEKQQLRFYFCCNKWGEQGFSSSQLKISDLWQ